MVPIDTVRQNDRRMATVSLRKHSDVSCSSVSTRDEHNFCDRRTSYSTLLETPNEAQAHYASIVSYYASDIFPII